jgi:CspA family cold shock protein
MSYSGSVKWFKGSYGFIIADDEIPGLSKEKNELFVYYTGIKSEGFRKLKRGQEVEFDVISGANGLQAVNVMVTKDVDVDDSKKEERD